MWMTVGELGNSPLAAVIGYGLGVLARRRGDSPWAAYALAQIPGLVLASIATLWFGRDVRVWPNALVWLAWSGFGVYHGWREPRRKPVIHALNLSGRDPGDPL